MPKVSVIIPTCNRAELLRSAITSVLHQTFQDLEIIIVDDASRDHTHDVVADFKDMRIKLLRHQVSQGAAEARNTGIMNSSGEYIAFLDDDDEWLPDKLQMQVDLLENSPPEVGGVCTDRFTIDRASGRVLHERNSKISLDISKGNYITTSSVLLRRKCFEEFGLFDQNLPAASDYDMWVRISKKFSFALIKEPLTKYYINESSLSFNYEKKARSLEILLKKHIDMFKLNPRAHGRVYLRIGLNYCYNGEPRKGRKAFKKAMRINPYEVRNYFNFCLSLLGAKRFKQIKKFKEKVSIRKSTKATL